MKKIFLVVVFFLAILNIAISQSCPDIPIQSPVSKKPTDAGVVSVNCNELTIKWKGNTGQTYQVTATTKDAASNKVLNVLPVIGIHQTGLTCSAKILVTPDTKVSWSVQGISVVNNREFYSYPLRSSKEILIPKCEKQAITVARTTNEDLVVTKDGKLLPKLYPNPVQSLLNVELDSKINSQKTLIIFDVYGKAVIKQQTTQNNIQVDVKRLPGGSYFIAVMDESSKPVFNARFIKQ